MRHPDGHEMTSIFEFSLEPTSETRPAQAGFGVEGPGSPKRGCVETPDQVAVEILHQRRTTHLAVNTHRSDLRNDSGEPVRARWPRFVGRFMRASRGRA